VLSFSVVAGIATIYNRLNVIKTLVKNNIRVPETLCAPGENKKKQTENPQLLKAKPEYFGGLFLMKGK